jgi:muramoyltetrapeptide carboxypeptidase
MSLRTSNAMRGSPQSFESPVKPRSLRRDFTAALFAPASPGDEAKFASGLAELKRLGWTVIPPAPQTPEAYFANSVVARRYEFLEALSMDDVSVLLAVRGGYGSHYLLDQLEIPAHTEPKMILGFSDITSLQIYLWQKHRWVTLHGPMLASGFAGGAGQPYGYEESSLLAALETTAGGWSVALEGEVLLPGEAQGRLLGGCLTLVQTALATPWELDTSGAILVLEDRGMKPWQVDRALMHLMQAGKFAHVKGIVLGDFPDCEPPVGGSPTVRDVALRILGPLNVPIVFGAPVGHTARPMLTVPLGVQARLIAKEQHNRLEILEPAVIA